MLVPPTRLPRLLAWLHHATPFTPFVSAALSTTLSGLPMTCAARDMMIIQPPATHPTCLSYLAAYMAREGGQLLNPDATADCAYCEWTHTDRLLERFGIRFAARWTALGVLLGFSAFNVLAAFYLYGKRVRRG